MNKQVEQIKTEIERLKESGCASPIVICDTLLAFIDSMREESKPKFKVGQTITDPTDSTFTFHINKIEDGRYIEKEDEWVLVKEADANYELVEEPVSEDMEDYHNMAKIGIVVGLLSIPVASMTNRFGFGQIPQLLGGIMAIGGALMAINHIMFVDK